VEDETARVRFRGIRRLGQAGDQLLDDRGRRLNIPIRNYLADHPSRTRKRATPVHRRTQSYREARDSDDYYLRG
jgi:hypothetical protein